MKKSKYIKPSFKELFIETNICVGSDFNNCTKFDITMPVLNKRKTKTFIINDDYEENWNNWNHDF